VSILVPLVIDYLIETDVVAVLSREMPRRILLDEV
jgi:hypothetical protein